MSANVFLPDSLPFPMVPTSCPGFIFPFTSQSDSLLYMCTINFIADQR